MTKKLLTILISLIFAMLIYVFVMRFEEIMTFIANFIDNIGKTKIVIPENNNYSRNYTYKTFKKTDNFEPENIDDIKAIFYTVLDNGWNDFTFYCKRDYKTCAKDVRDVANDEEFIALINNYVSPYNSFVNFNTTISGEKTVFVTVDKLYSDENIKVLNKTIDDIFKNLAITKDTLTINDIKSLHHYILNHTVYDKEYIEGDYTSTSNKAIGALIDGKAICSGYADSFALMMDKLQIPNYKISSEEHVWNVIYVNNRWSHVDATWDDDEDNLDNRSNFFMITTEKLYELDTSEHTFNEKIYLDFNEKIQN